MAYPFLTTDDTSFQAVWSWARRLVTELNKGVVARTAAVLSAGRRISISGKVVSAGGLFDGSTDLVLNVTSLLLTFGDVTTALTFTPYNATNPAGYISSITGAMVTTALGYTPTSVTGLTGVQTVAAFKTGLSLVKADVGLGSVDNTADAAKAVLSATKLTTARNIAITGDLAWNVTFDGTGNVTAAGTVVRINGVALSGLSTGILKNTTATGILSIAVAADFPTLNQNTTGSAATLTTSRNIDGQAFNGSANITVIAPGTHAATSKTTPVDADELPLVDSAASNVLAKLTWANLKATLKTYLDTLYQPLLASILSSWTAYTPTVTPSTGAFTTVSATGRYRQVGKTVQYSLRILITTNGTAGGIFIDTTAPVASVNSGYGHTFMGIEELVTGTAFRGYLLPNATKIRLQNFDGATYLGASGYSLAVSGTYEAA